MMSDYDDEKVYKVNKDYGVFDERGNTFLALRRVSWYGKDDVLELRRWRVRGTEEFPDKGFKFLTEDGAHNLAELLVEKGFGSTSKLMDMLDKRDKMIELHTDDVEENDEDDDDFYEASSLVD